MSGSVARREEHATSDVDPLVRLDPERSLLDLVALGDALGDELGRRVDVLTEGAISPYLARASWPKSAALRRTTAYLLHIRGAIDDIAAFTRTAVTRSSRTRRRNMPSSEASRSSARPRSTSGTSSRWNSRRFASVSRGCLPGAGGEPGPEPGGRRGPTCPSWINSE